MLIRDLYKCSPTQLPDMNTMLMHWEMLNSEKKQEEAETNKQNRMDFTKNLLNSNK